MDLNSAFEEVLAQTTSLKPNEINNVRALYHMYAQSGPVEGCLSHEQARHLMAVLGHGQDCEFDEDEEVVEFKDVLELCAAKKEKISTQEDKYRHVSSAGDPRAASAPDLSSLLLL